MIAPKWKQEQLRAKLLNSEDLADDDLIYPLHRYNDYDTLWDMRENSMRTLKAGRQILGMPETGSSFREDAWPSPNEGT